MSELKRIGLLSVSGLQMVYEFQEAIIVLAEDVQLQYAPGQF